MATGGVALGVALLCACSERYTRPPGPAPRYEVAPVLPWDAGVQRSEVDPLEAALAEAAGDVPGGDAGARQPGENGR